jgi:hypothetical protein
VTHVAVAPHGVAKDEGRIGAAAAAVEVTDGAPSYAGLAGGEGRGRGGRGDGCHEGDEGGGELHAGKLFGLVCFVVVEVMDVEMAMMAVILEDIRGFIYIRLPCPRDRSFLAIEDN